MSLHYDSDNSYLFVNGKEICKFKASNENSNFPSQFCLGTISKKFDYVDSEQVSFKGNVYGFSVDSGAFGKSNIINIQNIYWLKIIYKMFGKVFIVVLSSIANASNDAKCVLSSDARFNLPLLIYILMSTVKNFITIHFRLN